jgi:hypothetical protein
MQAMACGSLEKSIGKKYIFSLKFQVGSNFSPSYSEGSLFSV